MALQVAKIHLTGNDTESRHIEGPSQIVYTLYFNYMVEDKT